MEKYEEIERRLITKYRKDIYSKFVKAVADYKLINENDNVMVCISGGKDSFLLAKCIQELVKHGKYPFTAHYVVMDPGYNKKNREMIENNAKLLNIPIEIFESNIFESVASIDVKGACYLCARMRRGNLYAKAKELGCNKIALGHHFDDVIETTLLSMLYGAEFKTMMPKLHSDNFEGLELIRPLYLVHEDDIISWKNNNNLTFLNCACRFTEKTESKETDSKRREVKELIKELKKKNKSVDHNIFNATSNVNMNCILAWTKGKDKYSFLDEYEKND